MLRHTVLCAQSARAVWTLLICSMLFQLAGSPHIEVGLLNMPIALTLAAGLLVAGMPITVKRKEVGSCCLACLASCFSCAMFIHST